jgi:hypothetical protein
LHVHACVTAALLLVTNLTELPQRGQHVLLLPLLLLLLVVCAWTDKLR